jgi:transcriptional regulator with XRE-family HTH domain
MEATTVTRHGDQAAAPKSDSEVELGRRLREARRRLRMSLSDVAVGTGSSQSWLSRVERGLIDISFNRLTMLVNYYGMSVAELLGEAEWYEPHVVRRGENRAATTVAGYDMILLAAGRQLMPMLATYDPDAPMHEFVSHAGEEMVLVLEGSIILELQHGQSWTLEVGDSACYEGIRPHRLHAVGDSPAQVLAVITPVL